MIQEIRVTPEERKRLASVYKMTPQGIGLILRFKRNGLNAEKIRNDALKHGGKKFEIKEIETSKHVVNVLNSKGEIVNTIIE